MEVKSMSKRIKLISLLTVAIIILVLGGCVLPRFMHNTLIERMIAAAREYLAQNHPEFNLKLFAVYASTDEDPEPFERADDLAYWRLIFSDFDLSKSVEAIYKDGSWTSKVVDDIWYEDAVLVDPLYIIFDIQDAINIIHNRNPFLKYLGVYFHLPLDPNFKHPQYKFKIEDGGFAIFNSVTGEFEFSDY